MPTNPVPFIRSGMAPSLAVEVARQIDDRFHTNPKLMIGLGMSAQLATELCRQISVGVPNTRNLMGLGIPAELAAVVAGSIGLMFDAGFKTAALGDSNFAFMNRFNATGRALDIKPMSVIEISNARLGQRFRFWAWENGTDWNGANEAVGGWKLSDILAFLPIFIIQALAAGIDVVFFEIPATGDQTLNATTRIAQAASVIAQLRAAGFVVVVSYMTPRDVVADPADGWVVGDPRWQWRIDINTWASTQANANVFVWRTNPALYLDPPTGQPQQVAPLMFKDDAHTAAQGAYLWSDYDLDTIINTICPSGTWLPAASSPLNYWANYAVTGTSGVLGTGVDPGSVVATGMTLERVAGDATVAASKNASDQQVMTFTGGAATGVSTFYLRPTSTSYLAAAMLLPSTAYLATFAKFTSDNWNGFVDAGPFLYNSAGGIGYRAMQDTDQDHGGFNHAYEFTTGVEPMNRAVWAALRVRFVINVYGGNLPTTGDPVSGTGTITLKNMWHIETENSQTQFPLIRAVQ